jgi:hypothetical protein
MTPSARRALSLRVLCAPAAWPHWPFLPVVRRRGGRVQLGVVFDARTARLTGTAARCS